MITLRRRYFRPRASFWLSLSAFVGLALGLVFGLLSDALNYIEKGTTCDMLHHNQELLYGLRKAIATVEACDKDGVELGSITILGAEPAFTTQSVPFDDGPKLPRFAQIGGTR